MFLLSDYDYHLPESSIAQVPCRDRAASRLMHINRAEETVAHKHFADIEALLRPGDLLVVNNTRVIPARLFGNKPTGGKVEILIIDYAGGMKSLEETGVFQCDCMLRASRSPKPGSVIEMGEGQIAEVVSSQGYISQVRFPGGQSFIDHLKSVGEMPLPPYIKRNEKETEDLDGRKEKDKEQYQTVYAAKEGAVAAPTAGLHFTKPLMEALRAKGVSVAQVTLHVGYGTFVPVRCDDIRDHQIHSEYYEVPEETARAISRAKAEGRRVIAVGTTSVRTLEYISDENGRVEPGMGNCDLYIYPGYRFKCVDAMVTNFHLPKSTLLMLVSAFHDRLKMLDAYNTAVAQGYRFFSYGDAMFIE